jgi:phosphate transport system permease protein
MAVQTNQQGMNGYPEGEAATRQVLQRQMRACIWSNIYFLSTLVGILALLSLLYNIIDGAAGYVAIQNKVDPAAVVLAVEEEAVLAAPNLTSSEDDEELAQGVASNPYAIGFFGYAYLQEHSDVLKAVPVAGVAPSAEAIDAGSYPLARPLFIYTTAKVLQEKPQVAAFVDYYLNNVNRVIGEVGYFPVTQSVIDQGKATLQQTNSTAGASQGDIVIAGSSTVYPLTSRLAEQFTVAGFTGEITINNVGTKAGLARFCKGSAVDIANASRAINRVEREACTKAKREPIELRVGADALAVVVNRQNEFVNDLTIDQLKLLFTTAKTWRDVEPSWPNEPIQRFVPGADSGTLDYFVETVYHQELANLPKEKLVAVLQANVSRGLFRRFESEKPMAERSREEVYALVNERVVEPSVVKSWTWTESLLKREEIQLEVNAIQNGSLEWRNWVSRQFITSPQSSKPEDAGIRPAILGSLWVILFTIIFALPIGVGAAVYLEEYADKNSRINRLIETNINNLAGVPSIIYGMLGLAIFVRMMEALTSGKLFGVADDTTANGRTVLSAGLTLALLVLPVVIINAREAIRAVPDSLRQAGFGLGATRWQVVWAHVLPSALPGILTGAILAMSRAIGETAPLVVVGASTFIALDPDGPFSKFTTLPAQIYQWTSRPQAEFHHIAAAAIVVLMVMLLSLNALAITLRNRFGKQL